MGAALAFLALPGSGVAGTYANINGITVNDATPSTFGCPCTPQGATPYPSTISVSNEATITSLTVTLERVTLEAPDDIDILLVGPAGQKVVLLSDAGGGAFENGARGKGRPLFGFTNHTFVFSDGASGSAPDFGGIPTGTYKPTDWGPTPSDECTGGDPEDTYPAPAPAGPYSSTLSVFNSSSPNGTWSLYVVDDCFGYNGGGAGTIAAWCLSINTAAATSCGAPTAAAVSSFAARSESRRVEIAWRTGTEAGTAGFNVYRLSGGTAVKVNRALVVAKAGGTARGARYRLLDRVHAHGSYRLQVVRLDGSRFWAGRAAA